MNSSEMPKGGDSASGWQPATRVAAGVVHAGDDFNLLRVNLREEVYGGHTATNRAMRPTISCSWASGRKRGTRTCCMAACMNCKWVACIAAAAASWSSGWARSTPG